MPDTRKTRNILCTHPFSFFSIYFQTFTLKFLPMVEKQNGRRPQSPFNQYLWFIHTKWWKWCLLGKLIYGSSDEYISFNSFSLGLSKKWDFCILARSWKRHKSKIILMAFHNHQNITYPRLEKNAIIFPWNMVKSFIKKLIFLNKFSKW